MIGCDVQLGYVSKINVHKNNWDTSSSVCEKISLDTYLRLSGLLVCSQSANECICNSK